MTLGAAGEVERFCLRHGLDNDSDGRRVELRDADFFRRQRFQFNFALDGRAEPRIFQVDDNARRIFGVRLVEVNFLCHVDDNTNRARAVTDTN